MHILGSVGITNLSELCFCTGPLLGEYWLVLQVFPASTYWVFFLWGVGRLVRQAVLSTTTGIEISIRMLKEQNLGLWLQERLQ